ncbi:MAG TPA: hypothetical protein VIF09_03030 [Polyangiaceae bacterium]|jgi:hypothetical protein
MKRKERFPPEATTDPDIRRPKETPRQSGPAPRSKRSQPSTQPPPLRNKKGDKAPPTPRKSVQPRKPAEPRTSGMRSRKPASSEHPAATIDEVTADMSRDPRRERDDD